ncbi:MAG TPA: long-chain fatty acid--CoA ligase, partial [Rugosimonospora sp.]|nr:long-chain fatty acid--CoA ligase [Rugosimonospora sp.]
AAWAAVEFGTMTADYPTLPGRLLQAIDRYASPRAQIHKQGGQWLPITAKEMLRRIAGLSQSLANLGVAQGDRVALFAPNCPEWHVADFAALGLGAVVVPIYFRESAERTAYILEHSEAKIIFVAGEEQARRWSEMAKSKSGAEKVIFAGSARTEASGPIERRGSEPSGPSAGGLGETLSYEALIAHAGDAEIEAYRRRIAGLRSDSLASIIYTSGTTGEPKGVMLSHANFTSNVQASFERFDLEPGSVALSFLPLAHVYEREVDYGYLFNGVSVAYVPRMEDVPQALLEVRPHICAAVPRFFEKLYGNILERGAQTTGIRRRIFDWAIGVERKAAPWRAYGRRVPLGVRWQWRVANRLVYQKFRDGVGGRIVEFISGGAPLAPELTEFFTTVGLPLFQGYGLTETSPVVATNLPSASHIGTVGRPIPGVEVRTAEDGELLVRGPCVMQGYYKKTEETRAVLSSDGWLATGDIGGLDADGYLSITDRKKELLKTAGGKLIAPAPIENALKSSPFILSVALVGDRRPYIAALIVPNFATVQARALQAGVKLASPQEMVSSAWVRDLIEGEIKRLTANLAQFETIKRFALLDREFTFDGGELTFTLKLKRRVIDARYADLIERLYAQPAPVAR